MGRFNWGSEGPPEDAYSRVTEAQRFGPLHDWALEAVARLEADYEVARIEAQSMDTELERAPLSKPTIRLTPLQDAGAPVTIAFTDFPGLAVRFGRWVTEWFPSCGCDACDEMPDEEFERFTQLLDDVVAGRFRESLYRDGWRHAWRTREFWSDQHRRAGKRRVERGQARRMLGGEKKIVLEWMAWPPKPGR